MDHVLLDTTKYMADGKAKEDIIEQLQMCKTNCAFMSVAINRTVDFAKSTSDIALTPKMEPVSITDSMQWAVTCLKAFQPNVSIAVVPLPADICDVIVTDKHWLMENVLCYLSNAVKYSASGHVTVSASLANIVSGSWSNTDRRNRDNVGTVSETGGRRRKLSVLKKCGPDIFPERRIVVCQQPAKSKSDENAIIDEHASCYLHVICCASP
jgi:hypothetical protein